MNQLLLNLFLLIHKQKSLRRYEMKYRIVKVTDKDRWCELESEWRTLLLESDFNDIFLTYEWLKMSWEAFNKGRLFILALWENKKLISILPAYIKKHGIIRKLQFLGSGMSDYGGFIIHKNVDAENVIAAVIEYLLKEPGWDMVDFQQIAEISSTYRHIGSLDIQNKDKVFNISLKPMVKCLYIPNVGQKDNFESGINKKMLRYMKTREIDIKEKEDVSYIKIDKITNELLNCFYDMHINRWRAKGKKSVLIQKKYREFYTRIAKTFNEKGWLHMYALKFGDNYVAFEFAFLYNYKIYDYICTYDTKSAYFCPGNLLKRYLICTSKDFSVLELDLLRGEEEYKYKWTSNSRTNYRFVLYRNSIKGIIAFYLGKFLCNIKRVNIVIQSVHFIRNIGIKLNLFLWNHKSARRC